MDAEVSKTQNAVAEPSPPRQYHAEATQDKKVFLFLERLTDRYYSMNSAFSYYEMT
jgi:hypothetical protein